MNYSNKTIRRSEASTRHRRNRWNQPEDWISNIHTAYHNERDSKHSGRWKSTNIWIPSPMAHKKRSRSSWRENNKRMQTQPERQPCSRVTNVRERPERERENYRIRKRQLNGKEAKELNVEGDRSRKKKGDQLGTASSGGKVKKSEGTKRESGGRGEGWVEQGKTSRKWTANRRENNRRGIQSEGRREKNHGGIQSEGEKRREKQIETKTETTDHKNTETSKQEAKEDIAKDRKRKKYFSGRKNNSKRKGTEGGRKSQAKEEVRKGKQKGKKKRPMEEEKTKKERTQEAEEDEGRGEDNVE